LVLLEEHGEADDGRVYQQSTRNGHGRSTALYGRRVVQQGWKSYFHQLAVFTRMRSALSSLSHNKSTICDAPGYSPTPIITKKPVMNLPKSTTPFPELSMKSSWFAARPQIQFGKGAIT
jgi:hypothetical protein